MCRIQVTPFPDDKDVDDLKKLLKQFAPEGTSGSASGNFPGEWYIFDREGHKIAIFNMETPAIAWIGGDIPKWIVKISDKIQDQTHTEDLNIYIPAT